MKACFALVLLVVFSTVAAFAQSPNVFNVDGIKYPFTPAGIKQALNDAARANGGAVVIMGSPINMSGSSLIIPTNVCLSGVGGTHTQLRWTSVPNPGGIIIPAGTNHSCVTNMSLWFAASASNNACGIRINGSPGAHHVTQFNTFRDLQISTDSPAPLPSGSVGIFATGTTQPTDVSLNTFDNIVVQNMAQAFICAHCEGNWWKNVQGINLGANNSILFQEILSNDEVVDARMESGSNDGTNAVCYSNSGQLNQVRIVCDTTHPSSALQDTGGRNNYSVSLLGSSSLGTLNPTSLAIVSSLSGPGVTVFGRQF